MDIVVHHFIPKFYDHGGLVYTKRWIGGGIARLGCVVFDSGLVVSQHVLHEINTKLHLLTTCYVAPKARACMHHAGQWPSSSARFSCLSLRVASGINQRRACAGRMATRRRRDGDGE